ncbi:amidohydrolase family protein [Actinotalea sp. M2MS4P-6]|uniref:amidohydrolase family protein n=1 Tax=Actinotalea sp. M2MS4P-6 TaxID=2983762 RepID=UPI0021E3A97D|nr:amidohydrolase family protein [Actinotalea sp. M2MS4P-6]MCV2394618.1 amidohydrolase family protein [Actinotalea sp. M2MS4P-6]
MTATLYRRGVVHSAADPFAEALLVAGGVVAWLGPDEAADRVAAEADEVVDLDGALVTPAFVSSHAHLALAGVGAVDVTGLHGEAVLDALAPVDGPAVVGHGWQSPPDDADLGFGAEQLDRAVGGRPVLLLTDDVTAGLAGPGQVSADGWGTLRGDALLGAVAALLAAVPDAPERGLAAAARAGVVAVHEHSLPEVGSRADLAKLIAATADDDSGAPLVVGYRAELCETTDDARAIRAEIPGLTGIGGDLAVDGTIASWGAVLRQPYADAPQERGTLLLSAERIANHVASTTRAGLQAGFRAHGDAALDELLLGFRAAGDVEGVAALHAAGHRIDGLELVDAPALATLVLLGIRATVAPAAALAKGSVTARRLGALRAGGLLPLADLAGAGVPLGLASAPGRFDPWGAVRAAVLHPEAEQRISARAAFRAHTRGGWRLAGLDGAGAGEIRVGAPAHLAMWRADRLVVQAPDGRLAAWSTDPRAGTPLLPELGPDIPDPVCVRTLRAGHVIHDTLA